MRATMFKQQQTAIPSAPNRRDALHGPNPQLELRERQGISDHVIETCPYTALSLRKGKVMGVLLGAGALFAAWKFAGRPAARTWSANRLRQAL
jgi:hypothetical protein